MARQDTPRGYARIYNDDLGSIESKCNYCSRTIAQSREERTLANLEDVHMCISKSLASDPRPGTSATIC